MDLPFLRRRERHIATPRSRIYLSGGAAVVFNPAARRRLLVAPMPSASAILTGRRRAALWPRPIQELPCITPSCRPGPIWR